MIPLECFKDASRQIMPWVHLACFSIQTTKHELSAYIYHIYQAQIEKER